MTDDRRQHELATLPAGVQLLWGLRETGRRGPKPSLTRDEIVAAAIEIADAEGLAAVSMARVAEQVGSSTMALYRYVANKDELLLLMSDAGIADPPVLPSGSGPGSWRTGLTAWAHAVREIWMARPWLLQIPVTGPPAGPNNLAWLEAGLGALAGTGLPDAERIDVVMVLSTYLRGEAWLSLDLAAAATGDPESYTLDYGGAFARLLDPERFPHLAAIVAGGPFGDPGPPDDHHEIGLDIVLDGIARRIGP
jgi:AcrR family transcriptional regulator